jgi:hypothetical protein
MQARKFDYQIERDRRRRPRFPKLDFGIKFAFLDLSNRRLKYWETGREVNNCF